MRLGPRLAICSSKFLRRGYTYKAMHVDARAICMQGPRTCSSTPFWGTIFHSDMHAISSMAYHTCMQTIGRMKVLLVFLLTIASLTKKAPYSERHACTHGPKFFSLMSSRPVQMSLLVQVIRAKCLWRQGSSSHAFAVFVNMHTSMN